jgi:Ca2+-binding RTX toxin-like protein
MPDVSVKFPVRIEGQLPNAVTAFVLSQEDAPQAPVRELKKISIRQTYINADVGGHTHGGDGSDLILGGSRADDVFSGDGDDVVFGGGGDDSMAGGLGDDVIAGETGNDKLWGDGGNDYLFGGSGRDTLNAGDGDDVLYGDGVTVGGPAMDDTGMLSADAQTFNDLLLGGAGNDYIDGQLGNDETWAGAGNDTILGGTGDDRLNGEDGDDLLDGGDGSDWLSGGAGTDTARFSGQRSDYLVTANADGSMSIKDLRSAANGAVDRVVSIERFQFADRSATYAELVQSSGNRRPENLTLSANTVRENAAADTIIGKLMASDPDAGDTLNYSLIDDAGGRFKIDANGNLAVRNGGLLDYEAARSHTVIVRVTDRFGVFIEKTLSINLMNLDDTIATNGNDYLVGGSSSETMSALDGDDIVYGNGGDDVIRGGKGNDVLHGDFDWRTGTYNWGNDTLYGDDGNDQLLGQDGTDTLDGGNGDDFLDGGFANDRLLGGAGNDTLLGAEGNDRMEGGAGDDMLYGDFLWWWNAYNVGNDTLFGDDGDDQLFGQDGDDNLDGGSGRDFLDGGFGKDKLVGGDGKDVLWGADGDDRLQGGAGIDALLGGNGDDWLNSGTSEWVNFTKGDNYFFRSLGLARYSASDFYGGILDRITPGVNPVHNRMNEQLRNVDIMTGGAGRDVFVFSSNAAKDALGKTVLTVDAGTKIISDFAYGTDLLRFGSETGSVLPTTQAELAEWATSHIRQTNDGHFTFVYGDNNGDAVGGEWEVVLLGLGRQVDMRDIHKGIGLDKIFLF